MIERIEKLDHFDPTREYQRVLSKIESKAFDSIEEQESYRLMREFLYLRYFKQLVTLTHGLKIYKPMKCKGADHRNGFKIEDGYLVIKKRVLRV